MKTKIDLDAILAPIPGENPAGGDLRYTPTYEEIKEARRSDDLLEQGDWQREVKRADWSKVISTAVEALTKKTKDLQIVAWLTEALIKTEGFEGLAVGFDIINGFLNNFWDHVYPAIEDGDLEFRAAPLEFMNEKLWVSVRDVPLTDTGKTPGYSWLKWQESRAVGFEVDTRNRYGDVDDNKKRARDEKIAEGKLTGEDFDSAVEQSKRAYYETLFADLTRCIEGFKHLDATVDEKFGADAPRLAEFKESLEVCERLVAKILKEKREKEPDPEPRPEPAAISKPPSTSAEAVASEPVPIPAGFETMEVRTERFPTSAVPPAAPAMVQMPLASLSDSGSLETARWEAALQILQSSGIKKALEMLFVAACSAPSVREKNRYRLLTARLCLKADRIDLARPIVEELYALIEELHLERWESPMWIAEVMDALYQCLTKGEPSDSDLSRAGDLFQKLCTTDVTRAMIYRAQAS